MIEEGIDIYDPHQYGIYKKRTNGVHRRWGFKSKTQLPLFMIWDEYWENGEVLNAMMVFNSRDWIGF